MKGERANPKQLEHRESDELSEIVRVVHHTRGVSLAQ